MSTEIPNQRPDFTGLANDRHDRYLRRFLMRRLGNSQDARELAQEVWARLLRVKDPHVVQSPMAYIRRTAANVLAEFRMRQAREPVTFDSELVEAADGRREPAGSGDIAEQLNLQQQLQRMLSQLPGMYRTIVLMRLCDGSSYLDIGRQLGLSAGTAERYFFRAMNAIRAGKGP